MVLIHRKRRERAPVGLLFEVGLVMGGMLVTSSCHSALLCRGLCQQGLHLLTEVSTGAGGQ